MSALCSTPSPVPGHTCGLPPDHDGNHTATHGAVPFVIWGNNERKEANDG